MIPVPHNSKMPQIIRSCGKYYPAGFHIAEHRRYSWNIFLFGRNYPLCAATAAINLCLSRGGTRRNCVLGLGRLMPWHRPLTPNSNFDRNGINFAS